MKVIFSHGKESGPWGTKIKHLARIAKECGCDVNSIDYQGIDDPDVRVKKLIEFSNSQKDDYILVGSSMGGYVSIIAASQLKAKGVFLMAPALYMPGYENKAYALTQANVSVVHGWNDEIIPWKHSLRFADKNHSAYHLLKSDHRLINVLDDIGNLFQAYLAKVMQNT